MQTAAVYLRSSKDRHDVSIETQRIELQQLALSKKLQIVNEFVDVVESGKDENRPGFQRLIQAVRNPKRGWSTLLILDTSRLARRRHIAIIFEEVEAKKHGVSIIYKSLPETDPITEMLLKSLLQAFDEWHSLTSKQKGLAGMAQNVRSGFRAGGRAPIGYQLVKHQTGAIREGEPVVKTTLQPSVDAISIGAYLKARAAGMSRNLAVAKHGLTQSPSTLVCVEWNALTYAGHTVWNVHLERKGGKTATGEKRRPRSEWVIQRNTHDPLITDQEAEILLDRLQAYGGSKRRTSARYLLTGLLKRSDGTPFHGDAARDIYRAGNQRIKRNDIEKAVVQKIMQDLQSPEFVIALTKAAKAQSAVTEDPTNTLRPKINEITGRISAMMDLVPKMDDPSPALRKINDLETERKRIISEIQRLETEYTQTFALAQVSEHTVRRILVDLAEELQEEDRENLKEALLSVVNKITFDAGTRECVIHYRIATECRDKLASPGLRNTIPTLNLKEFCKIN